MNVVCSFCEPLTAQVRVQVIRQLISIEALEFLIGLFDGDAVVAGVLRQVFLIESRHLGSVKVGEGLGTGPSTRARSGVGNDRLFDLYSGAALELLHGQARPDLSISVFTMGASFEFRAIASALVKFPEACNSPSLVMPPFL